MTIEIEKKYRLTAEEKRLLPERLREADAVQQGVEEFEENTLYGGHTLNPRMHALRLRRTSTRALLTYKERDPSASAIKQRREEETEVGDPNALAAILDALGYRPALVYEKRRTTWRLAGAEVVLDELPFGLFAEIEGTEDSILEAERILNLSGMAAEHDSYPELTARHGTKIGEVIESRFDK